MFTVKEYAEEMGITVNEVLKKCAFLGLDAKNSDDVLEEDDVIMLDNAINIDEEVENEEEFDEETEEEFDDYSETKEDIINKTKIKKQEPKKEFNKSQFAHKRKEMYKNKTKLQSNENTDDSIVLYKENMSVKELADALGISGNDLVVKLMGMGRMISLNEYIDLEKAEILALEYGKTLKK